MRVAAPAIAVLILAALAVTASTGERTPPGPAQTLEDARARLAAELDRTAGGALGHLEWRAGPPSAPALCEGPGGVPARDERTTSLGREAALPAKDEPAELVQSAAADWRARGHAEIERDAADPLSPILTARRDGILLELVVDGRRGRVFLGGSTPCLAPERLRRAG